MGAGSTFPVTWTAPAACLIPEPLPLLVSRIVIG